MKKKIIMFAINAVFVGLIAVIWTSLALTYILPTAENATHDTVIFQPDTLSFEDEMALVDSIIGSQSGISYETVHMIPNLEIGDFEENHLEQTLIRYPNGMPKITTSVCKTDTKPTRHAICDFMLLFYADNGHQLASGFKYVGMPSYKWWCTDKPRDRDKPTDKFLDIRFIFSNPNLCRNITQH